MVLYGRAVEVEGHGGCGVGRVVGCYVEGAVFEDRGYCYCEALVDYAAVAHCC